MPRVVPFYAIKCNPEPGVVRLLAALGAGFDCASAGEVAQVLALGVPPSRVIFAHPCKRGCDIRYARDHGVALTTFDTESELHKISAGYPGFKCVLRIRADDPEARVPLGLKYGANPDEAPRLLATAQRLGLDVVGVSFHVGSACKNLAAYNAAIEKAKQVRWAVAVGGGLRCRVPHLLRGLVAGRLSRAHKLTMRLLLRCTTPHTTHSHQQIFDLGAALGFSMSLLDIGGGFTGHFDACGNVMFGDIATTINGALAAHFPPESGVQVIAEPGRYFAETAGTLLTPIYGVRDRTDGPGGGIKKDYWITDGLYGSFNCIL
jgi:ornithine decarboxylase